MKFIILKSRRTGQWYIRQVASNGKKLNHSETYHNLADAKKAVDLIKKKAATAEVIIKK